MSICRSHETFRPIRPTRALPDGRQCRPIRFHETFVAEPVGRLCRSHVQHRKGDAVEKNTESTLRAEWATPALSTSRAGRHLWRPYGGLIQGQHMTPI